MAADNVDHVLGSAGDGDMNSLKYFIEKCNVSVNATDKIGRTALHKAAFKGKDTAIEYLLSKGAEINPKIKSDDPELSGATPLAWAVMSGHVSVAKTLIQHGANVDVSVNGYNLLGIAVMSDNPDMIAFILGYVGIDDYDLNGRTPLIIALGEEKYKSVQLLLEKGADYRKCSSSGAFPLGIAVQEKGSKGTELLLKHVESKEGKKGLIEYINLVHASSGRTALHLACMAHNYDIVKILLENGADYKIKDSEGNEADRFLIGDSDLICRIRYLFGPYYLHTDAAKSEDS